MNPELWRKGRAMFAEREVERAQIEALDLTRAKDETLIKLRKINRRLEAARERLGYVTRNAQDQRGGE